MNNPADKQTSRETNIFTRKPVISFFAGGNNTYLPWTVTPDITCNSMHYDCSIVPKNGYRVMYRLVVRDYVLRVCAELGLCQAASIYRITTQSESWFSFLPSHGGRRLSRSRRWNNGVQPMSKAVMTFTVNNNCFTFSRIVLVNRVLL